MVGSVEAHSNLDISGVILFGGPFGLAGVQSGELLLKGFSAPVETDLPELNTGVAVMNLDTVDRVRDFQLWDTEGNYLAEAEASIPAGGQIAQFVNQFNWNPPVDLKVFKGLIKMTGGGFEAATAIQVRGAQFATLPVKAVK